MQPSHKIPQLGERFIDQSIPYCFYDDASQGNPGASGSGAFLLFKGHTITFQEGNRSAGKQSCGAQQPHYISNYSTKEGYNHSTGLLGLQDYRGLGQQ